MTTKEAVDKAVAEFKTAFAKNKVRNENHGLYTFMGVHCQALYTLPEIRATTPEFREKLTGRLTK